MDPNDDIATDGALAMRLPQGWVVWVYVQDYGMCRLGVDNEPCFRSGFSDYTCFSDREACELAIAAWRLRHGG